MKLSRSVEGKRVRLVDVDGEVFEGIAGDYIFPEDNEPEGVASIFLSNCPQRSGMTVEFYETDIETIEVIQ